MKKQSKPPQFSESIGAFCRMMEDAQKDYAWNYSEVNRMDRLTQDYLHKLARREYKDTVEILEPLVQFLESDKGKNLLNLMREALGKTRKVEKCMETRTYIPRVLEQEVSK